MNEFKMQTISDMEKNILKVSTQLFLDQGYDKTTIRQIAEECGIGRGHLYYYFRKKEDILIHIFKQILNKIYDDVIESSNDKTEVLLSYATIQCVYTYTLVLNEKLFRIYLQGSNIEIVRRAAQNILIDLCKKKAEDMNYDIREKDICFSVTIGYSGECELLKRYYHGEKDFDIDSIVRSITSTRLLLLNIINHKQVDEIVDKAMAESKQFDYQDIIGKFHYFEF
ncbi:TetR/AcrR family transcriptional regulator [Terrisporobacter vanillatitrophus]|uniref:TetR/AcrR family transcriptional regulator n=1 Tax=Terrisporobacter vanillatitrophus TaxID=3058402 RepID=UPI0033669FF6